MHELDNNKLKHVRFIVMRKEKLRNEMTKIAVFWNFIGIRILYIYLNLLCTGGDMLQHFLWKSHNLQESILSFLDEWILRIENLGCQAQWQVPLHAELLYSLAS